MSVRLSHKKESAQIVVLTAEVADYDTRGNSSQSHQGGKTGGVVFAEANSTTKEKFVQIVSAVFAGRQRITKPMRPEKLESAVDCSARIGILGDPGSR
jgi:hypothetical protein